MKIECTQENLKKGLNIVSRIISKNTNLPILNNVYIETKENKLKVIATDLEMGIEFVLPCKVIEEGNLVVPGLLFSNYINSLPSSNITIESKETEMSIKCSSFKTKINCFNSDDFPILPEIEKGFSYSLSGVDFFNALSKIAFSIANNKNRPEINGLLFKIENENLFLVGTDSYRLTEKKMSIENKDNVSKEIIIPLSTVQEIIKILQVEKENLNIVISDNQILIKTKSISLISRLITGEYPDYKQIVPDDFNTSFKFNKNEFLNIIKNIGLFSDKTSSDINIKTNVKDKKLIIESKNNQFGENIAEIDKEIFGEDNFINFNYQYILDGLNSIDEDIITFSFINENMPALIKGENNSDYIYIVMPIRI
jgi:DNA polymerase-3 subunit beta